jgi:hypothetical protein
MLGKAKEEVLLWIQNDRKNLGVVGLDQFESSEAETSKVLKMLNLIYLTQYEWTLQNRSTWLVDLKAVAELLIMASMHILLMEVLALIPH